jgi:hypothetical protein
MAWRRGLPAASSVRILAEIVLRLEPFLSGTYFEPPNSGLRLYVTVLGRS